MFKYPTDPSAVWLQTDGYAAYNQFDEVPGIVTLNCWAHARRKFINAQSFDAVKAGKALAQIQLLYAVEKYWVENNYAPDQVKDHRTQHTIPY